jgi:hypothetical protein
MNTLMAIIVFIFVIKYVDKKPFSTGPVGQIPVSGIAFCPLFFKTQYNHSQFESEIGYIQKYIFIIYKKPVA